MSLIWFLCSVYDLAVAYFNVTCFGGGRCLIRCYIAPRHMVVFQSMQCSFVTLSANAVLESGEPGTIAWRGCRRLSFSPHGDPQCPVRSSDSPLATGYEPEVWKFVVLGVKILLFFSILLFSCLEGRKKRQCEKP